MVSSLSSAGLTQLIVSEQVRTSLKCQCLMLRLLLTHDDSVRKMCPGTAEDI